MHEKADLELKQAREYALRRYGELVGMPHEDGAAIKYELEKAVLYGLRLGAANATRAETPWHDPLVKREQTND